MATQKKQPEYFGRYQVIEELGSGAMGVVYLCIDPRLARPVAVKVLKEGEHMSPQEREQYRTRFRHEAEAAGRLNHPDIVQVFDIGSSFMVMEFLEGRPLSALLKGGAVLSVRQIASLILRVADAIDYAHRNGVVHRDIKPGNVMVLNDGGVKVMDFGVARLDSSTLTVAGTVVGSVRYMARCRYRARATARCGAASSFRSAQGSTRRSAFPECCPPIRRPRANAVWRVLPSSRSGSVRPAM